MTDAPGAAARAETKAKTKKITYGTLKLDVPTKLPFNTLAFMKNDMGPADTFYALESVIGPEQMAKVTALNLDIEQGNELMEKVFKAAGAQPGN